MKTAKTAKTAKTTKKFCVAIHFEGSVVIDVDARNEDSATSKAEQAFADMDAVTIANAIEDSWADTVIKL